MKAHYTTQTDEFRYKISDTNEFITIHLRNMTTRGILSDIGIMVNIPKLVTTIRWSGHDVSEVRLNPMMKHQIISPMI